MSEENWEETDLESINIGDYLKCITTEISQQGDYEVKKGTWYVKQPNYICVELRMTKVI